MQFLSCSLASVCPTKWYRGENYYSLQIFNTERPLFWIYLTCRNHCHYGMRETKYLMGEFSKYSKWDRSRFEHMKPVQAGELCTFNYQNGVTHSSHADASFWGQTLHEVKSATPQPSGSVFAGERVVFKRPVVQPKRLEWDTGKSSTWCVKCFICDFWVLAFQHCFPYKISPNVSYFIRRSY